MTAGLALLRSTGLAALVLLLWNPATSRLDPGNAPTLVLLDASLSMGGHGGRWREALDSARALARGGIIWRFGSGVGAYDSLPPHDGATRLAPALAAAAGRAGPVSVVTDGAIDDATDLPADLLAHARIVVLSRPPFFDAFVSDVAGPRQVSAGDTVRLRVSFGTAGKRDAGSGMRDANLTVSLDRRRIISKRVALPDSGVVSTDLPLPASRIPHPGWVAVEVGLEGVGDEEPRDDARWFVLDVSPQPSVVLLASPPDWDSRFLARTLSDVARVPVRVFVEAEPGAGRWRDAATLAPVATPDVARAVAGARLVVRTGDPAALERLASPPKGAVLTWPTVRGQEGDWYVQPPGPSPLAGALAGVAWDSLAPAAAVSDVALPPDSAGVVVLSARLARRGAPRPVIVLSERAGARRASVAATGLFRWAFRGGANGEAYRAVIAALADWLLAGGEGRGERFVPLTYEVPNGTPLAWRWTGSGAPQDVAVTLTGGGTSRTDTLRFDATGRAELRLAPGVYAYASPLGGGGGGGAERGVVAVDTYSDEWRPAAPVLLAQPGAALGRLASTAMRERWWLFVVAIAAFAGEWAWRRRQGLP